MKISVIFTGGTIGSCRSGGYIMPDNAANDILSRFFAGINRHSFEFHSPVSVLSENICIDEINLIASKAAECSKSDAVIITHGTDSLAYSAAALSYLLYDIKIPVVIVSSTHILTDKRANGLKNLSDAVTFIEQAGDAGVYVCNNGLIHLGTRLCPPTAYCGECKSILNTVFGSVKNGKFHKNNAFSKSPSQFTPYKTLQHKKILVISPHPQQDYDGYSRKYDAVLHLSYHSGTVDTKNKSFIRFCGDLTDAAVPIFLHGSYRGADYAGKAEFDKLGLRVLPVMSAAAAYMKLMLANASEICLSLSDDIILEYEI